MFVTHTKKTKQLEENSNLSTNIFGAMIIDFTDLFLSQCPSDTKRVTYIQKGKKQSETLALCTSTYTNNY